MTLRRAERQEHDNMRINFRFSVVFTFSRFSLDFNLGGDLDQSIFGYFSAIKTQQIRIPSEIKGAQEGAAGRQPRRQAR